jgi:hypothetical protein
MNSARFILLITALTDFIINAGTALGTAMVAQGNAQIPSAAVIILAVIGGTVAAARTVQQALKVTPETMAGLRNDPPPEVTKQGNTITTTMKAQVPEKK